MYRPVTYSNLVRFAIICLAALAARQSSALCLDPPGDINSDGLTTVVDVQCVLLAVMTALSGGDPPQAFCAALPGGADMDCDGAVTVGDAMLSIHFALKTPLPTTIDQNGDQCADGCAAECGDEVCNENATENCWSCPSDCSCNDENPCTQDSCDPQSGQCVSTPLLGPCDDGDPCTGNDQCGAMGCIGGTNICPNTICTPVEASTTEQYTVGCNFWGNKGDVVDCDILVYRAKKSAIVPHAFQMAVGFEQPLQFVSIYDHFCGGGATCAECDVYKLQLSTGHQVSAAPNPKQKWNDTSCADQALFVCKPDNPTNCLDGPCAGGGGLVLTSLLDPVNPLTDAYLDTNGTMVGNPKIATLRFTLEQDVDATNPVQVVFGSVLVVDYVGILPAMVDQNQIIVLSKY